jgi:uncharacterized RDD family membrane protein YckC
MPYCNRCGSAYGFGTDRCARCGADLPKLQPETESRDLAARAPRPATGRRVVAGLIDLAIAYGLWYLVVLLLSRRFPLVRALLWQAWFFLVIVVPNPYLLLRDAIEGKSVGKLVMGLVVYNETDRRAGGVWDSINRNWVLALPFVGSTLMALMLGVNILAGRQQRLGDKWAHTMVLSDVEYLRVRCGTA